MKTLWMELQRWNKQRVVVCLDCGGVLGKPGRHPIILRKSLEHWADTGHRVRVRRPFGFNRG